MRYTNSSKGMSAKCCSSHHLDNDSSNVSGGKRARKDSTQAAKTMKDHGVEIQRPTKGGREEGGRDYSSLRV